MKASIYARMQYVTSQNLPGGWPLAPALYDPKIGMQCFRDGIEKLEFADHLGFDWISFSEHHYSNNSVAPHPAIIGCSDGRPHQAGQTRHPGACLTFEQPRPGGRRAGHAGLPLRWTPGRRAFSVAR